jgi:hypothetical protein
LTALSVSLRNMDANSPSKHTRRLESYAHAAKTGSIVVARPPDHPAHGQLFARPSSWIEDNDDGREALVLASRTLGHEVHAANTGRAGIELVQQT